TFWRQRTFDRVAVRFGFVVPAQSDLSVGRGGNQVGGCGRWKTEGCGARRGRGRARAVEVQRFDCVEVGGLVDHVGVGVTRRDEPCRDELERAAAGGGATKVVARGRADGGPNEFNLSVACRCGEAGGRGWNGTAAGDGAAPDF